MAPVNTLYIYKHIFKIEYANECSIALVKEKLTGLRSRKIK